MRSVIPVALLVCTVFGVFAAMGVLAIGGCSKAGSSEDGRKAELVYLRTVLPPSLLEFAHVEAASTESLSGAKQGAWGNARRGERGFSFSAG